jgi:hypothetical protein
VCIKSIFSIPQKYFSLVKALQEGIFNFIDIPIKSSKCSLTGNLTSRESNRRNGLQNNIYVYCIILTWDNSAALVFDWPRFKA